MDKRFMILIVVLFLAVTALSGCSITGRSADVLTDDVISCSMGTRIAFLDIGDVTQACYGDDGLYFAVENLGTVPVTGLSVFLQADYNVTFKIDADISSGVVSQHSLAFGKGGVGRSRIRVTPLVGAGRVACTESAIEVDIRRC